MDSVIRIKEKNMDCPHRPSTIGEQNLFECTFPKECPRHGKCCACVAHHRKNGKLPHCLRDLNVQPQENQQY